MYGTFQFTIFMNPAQHFAWFHLLAFQQVYNGKKKAAEDQLETAKDLCEKLKKKRSSLVGAFVSTHGCSIDEVRFVLHFYRLYNNNTTNKMKYGK
jgi:hypothetical protein